MSEIWIRIYSFDDQVHGGDRDAFEKLIQSSGQAFRKETLPLNGADKGRSETVFEIPVTVTGKDRLVFTEETRSAVLEDGKWIEKEAEAASRLASPALKKLRAAWRGR